MIAGANNIVSRCLGLEAGQQFVIFLDESTVEPAVAIAEAAEALAVPSTLVLVPQSIQKGIPARGELSLLARGVAREARAILICVNDQPDCLPFRRRLLQSNWTARTRIGHMPGASLEGLKLADVDFDKLSEECSRLQIALARGSLLELISFSRDGQEHILCSEIGGWERLPVASDGVISDGAWGNVPSGETYIAPVEGTAEGSIIINGSIPGKALEPDNELVLHFEDGKLIRIEPSEGEATHWLYTSQLSPAISRRDPNWSNLAEIGVGLNPAVNQLSGNMLFDEKAAGTAHIAIGSNLLMGGKLEASIHCDMVTRAPSLRVDHKLVVERGNLVFTPHDWIENYAQIILDESPVRNASRVARSGIQAGHSSDGRLQRILRPDTGKVMSAFVGDRETARLANTLYTLLPAEGEWLPIRELEELDPGQDETVRRILHILWNYELVKIR